jgi:hypothetical protein
MATTTTTISVYMDAKAKGSNELVDDSSERRYAGVQPRRNIDNNKKRSSEGEDEVCKKGGRQEEPPVKHMLCTAGQTGRIHF